MHGSANPVRNTSHEDVRSMTLGELEELGRRQRQSAEPGMGIPTGARTVFFASALFAALCIAALTAL